MPLALLPRPRAARPLLLALALGCGGGGGDPTGTGGPPAAVATVVVPAPALTLFAGSTQTLVATPRDAAGQSVAGATVSWSSSDPTVATVSSAGLVTALALGSTTITAASGGRQATVELTVRGGGTVSSAGGTVTAGPAARLQLPAGAIAQAIAITIDRIRDAIANEHVVGGTAHDFGPDGTQFGQPVTLELTYDPAALPEGSLLASLRVAKLVAGRWQVLGQGEAQGLGQQGGVDSVSRHVRASINAFSSYAIVSDPCVPRQLGPTGIRGRISEDDCLYAFAGRRSDYYAFTPAAGEVVVLAPTGGLTGLIGLKEATTDAAQGAVWGARAIGDTLRLIANGDPLQLYVSGQDSTHYGSYHVVRSTETAAYRCNRRYYLTPGAAVAQTLTPATSCRTTIQFSPFPEVIGQPIDVQYFYAKLVAGRTHTLTLDGMSEGWQPGLTLFRDGQVAAQSVGYAAGTRRVLTVTPETDGYYAIEISSGPPPQGSTTLPSGSYTLTTSR